MKRGIFQYLVALSALLVAASAAFFSVYGLSMLFAGAKTQVIVMAGSLEFSKLIMASFLYRYWGRVSKVMKTYMTIAVIVLMVITSGGIYGFLSSAYQDTATKYQKRDAEISTLVQKKNIDSVDVVRYQESLNKEYESKNRYQTNLDTLYNRKFTTTAKRIEQSILRTDQKISELDSLIRVKNDVIGNTNKQILELNNENISGEIGPLKYISDLTGYPMDKVVNWFILLLIIVFDPLAVSMIIATNVVIKFSLKKDDKNIIEIKKEKSKDDIDIEEHLHHLFKKIDSKKEKKSIPVQIDSKSKKISKIFPISKEKKKKFSEHIIPQYKKSNIQKKNHILNLIPEEKIEEKIIKTEDLPKDIYGEVHPTISKQKAMDVPEYSKDGGLKITQ